MSLTVCRDGAEVTCSGRLFQTREAATVKVLTVTVDVCVDGMTSADIDDVSRWQPYIEVHQSDMLAPGCDGCCH